MKKIFKLIMLIALMTCTVFAGSHKYKKPEFTSFKEYKVVDTVHNIPMSLKLGVSEGKDLLYIPGYGRIFLEKTDYGYRDINNNMDVFVKNNGSIEVKANVTMIDLNFMYPDKYKKGEFYHSLSGFLHSHIYPMIEENKIKIGEDTFNVKKSVNDFDQSIMYKEENGKFTLLYLPNWSRENISLPDLAEFKFTVNLEEVK